MMSPASNAPSRTSERSPASTVALFFGVCAAPAAWGVQLLSAYPLAVYPCYPNDIPLAQVLPGWEGDRILLFVINVVALLIALAGVWVSWRNWQATRHGDKTRVEEIGEGKGEFFALSGLIVSLGFLAVLLFDTTVLVGVPQCSG